MWPAAFLRNFFVVACVLVRFNLPIAMISLKIDETRDTPAREDETHPLADLLDLLTAAVHEYEADHHAVPASSPRDVLRFLMDQHGLNQSDLAEVGSQSVISEILAGRRMLNTRQIAALVQRFHISADAFIERVERIERALHRTKLSVRYRYEHQFSLIPQTP